MGITKSAKPRLYCPKRPRAATKSVRLFDLSAGSALKQAASNRRPTARWLADQSQPYREVTKGTHQVKTLQFAGLVSSLWLELWHFSFK
jgi:hypothetical protein